MVQLKINRIKFGPVVEKVVFSSGSVVPNYEFPLKWDNRPLRVNTTNVKNKNIVKLGLFYLIVVIFLFLKYVENILKFRKSIAKGCGDIIQGLFNRSVTLSFF